MGPADFEKLQEIQNTQKDLDSLTKAEISQFSSEIGLSVSGSLTKAKMIEKVLSSPEFTESEDIRRAKLFYDWAFG